MSPSIRSPAPRLGANVLDTSTLLLLYFRISVEFVSVGAVLQAVTSASWNHASGSGFRLSIRIPLVSTASGKTRTMGVLGSGWSVEGIIICQSPLETLWKRKSYLEGNPWTGAPGRGHNSTQSIVWIPFSSQKAIHSLLLSSLNDLLLHQVFLSPSIRNCAPRLGANVLDTSTFLLLYFRTSVEFVSVGAVVVCVVGGVVGATFGGVMGAFVGSVVSNSFINWSISSFSLNTITIKNTKARKTTQSIELVRRLLFLWLYWRGWRSHSSRVSPSSSSKSSSLNPPPEFA